MKGHSKTKFRQHYIGGKSTEKKKKKIKYFLKDQDYSQGFLLSKYEN